MSWTGISQPKTLSPSFTRSLDAPIGDFSRFKRDAVYQFLADAAAALRKADPESRIGAQAGVVRDVPAGAAVSGTPAVPLMQYLRQAVILGRLAGKKTGKNG